MVTAKLLKTDLTAAWKKLAVDAGSSLEVLPATDAVGAFTVYITFDVTPDDAVDLEILGVAITTLNYFANVLKCVLSTQLVQDSFDPITDADIHIVTYTGDVETGRNLITSFRVGAALFPKA